MNLTKEEASQKLNTEEKGKKDPMEVVAKGIISGRYIILLAFIVAFVYCLLSINKVQVNEDITAFLPDSTETRQGLVIMEEEFITYGTANIMVSNITFDTAEKIAQDLETFEHVTDVTFDDTTNHYKNSSGLFTVSFDGTESDQVIIDELDSIKSYLSGYDNYVDSTIGENYSAELAEQMVGVIIVVAIVVTSVLLFTSRSYFEVVIFGLIFIFAGVLNMGTNFWLGEISSITNSVAIVLQLALAIDYSIILCHRYQDEVLICSSEREALTKALAKAIIEISSSSLTTISGLLALTFMQFRLGYDLGIVLTKGIICSLLCVFLLMPCFISFFPRQLKKTAHKSLVPDITVWGKFLANSKYCFVIVFIIIVPFSIWASSQVDYVFADDSVDEIVSSERSLTRKKVATSFDEATPVAVIVPTGDYEKERKILDEIDQIEEIKSATGLANIEIEEGKTLTDKYTPRMFAELTDIDIEQAYLLYQIYGIDHEQYQVIFGDYDSYSVTLIDMIEYLFDKMDHGVVTFTGEKQDTINELRDTLKRGTDQLRGENWDRLVCTATVPVEGEESENLIAQIRQIAENEYGEGNILVVGDITSTKDLADTYNSDSLKISLITIAFVFLVILFTFKTVVGTILLVFVIQGSIWINFSFMFLTDMSTSFITNMIVSAIQMGATIDYAIVIMNRYLTLRKEKEPKDAIVQAVKESFATVITSGSILTIAGFLLAYMVADPYIGHIGLAVGRGALISIVLVLTVLPQFILLCDKLIEKTKFTINLNFGGKKSEENS